MMRQVRLLKAIKGLPPGTLVWAKTISHLGIMHTLWQTPHLKVYLGCVDIKDEYFEVVEGVPPAAVTYEVARRV
jgi:hypothetical protein